MLALLDPKLGNRLWRRNSARRCREVERDLSVLGEDGNQRRDPILYHLEAFVVEEEISFYYQMSSFILGPLPSHLIYTSNAGPYSATYPSIHSSLGKHTAEE